MRRILALALAATVLVAAGDPHKRFAILGASIDVRVTRGARTLPATLVPALRPGDVIDLSFPRGVQFSSSPRWHLVVADLYDDYLKQRPTFPIADADLSAAPAGHVWRVRYTGKATPIMFLVPEDGSRRGRGIPDARAAIDRLENRSLLLRTATLSQNAAVKRSTMDRFLASLANVQPSRLPDAHARIAAASKALFGADLSQSACFDPSRAQSTQVACAAQAIASSYDAGGHVDVTSAVTSQLAVNTATYGMLMGTLYELLAKRRVAAHYTFVPGVIRPGGKNTDVYVDQQPSYDASSANPSTIVYFSVGDKGASERPPSYGAPAVLPLCADGSSLAFTLPFDASPVYFRSQALLLHSSAGARRIALTYDPLEGFSADLPSSTPSAGAEVTVRSTWGFDRIVSRAMPLVRPRAASWLLANPVAVPVVAGAKKATLRFSDERAGIGTCVSSVDLTDALGHTLPVTSIERGANAVTVTFDASQAGGAAGTALVHQPGGIVSAPVAFPIYPALPTVSSAMAYLPEGRLILRGENLKYIDRVTLNGTAITFANGSRNADGSWAFTAPSPTAYDPQWTHDTMTITYTMQAPDPRTGKAIADVIYAPSIVPQPVPTKTTPRRASR